MVGQQVVIECHGKPWVPLVSVDGLELLEQGRATSARPLGALAMVGAWVEVEEKDLDAVMEEVYFQREKDLGRQASG